VPVTAALAARSAVQEGASALVVDVAGPTTYAVEGPLLDGLARGWTLTNGADGPGWAQPVE
ncbi:MAG: SseB family protein, partial [Nocardioides sp.]